MGAIEGRWLCLTRAALRGGLFAFGSNRAAQGAAKARPVICSAHFSRWKVNRIEDYSFSLEKKKGTPKCFLKAPYPGRSSETHRLSKSRTMSTGDLLIG